MASSSSPQKKYQVFLSFRGANTRYNFTSHLLKALKDSGVSVFFDEDKLEKGEDIAPALTTAIAATNISVIILSEDYASSNSCLDELRDIMNLKKTEGHIVCPIFYLVDPSHVEKVDGSFKTSFQEHEKNRPAEQVEGWKSAFIEVGKLRRRACVIGGGQDDRLETEYIRDIVDSVTFALTKHQIFLSFGETTRLNFTSHLHKALECRGLNAVLSNGTPEKKSQAIADSDISIIIFSDDYVSSESSKAEVSEIMKHRKTREHTVLPIFYQVKPSYVRREISDFGEAGNIKGWTITRENGDGSEADCIEVVAKDVILKLQSKCRNVSEGKFGLYYQKQEILRLVEKEGTRVIGLWGPGGIGKTTLAEAIFNEISPYFEARSFVQNVREKIIRQGFHSLRDKLLSNLLKSEIRVETPSISCNVTKDRMKNIKVLVVLDDVSEVDHIAEMGIENFGDGSKIIVTSRDSQVIVMADEKYKVDKLSENCSLHLFSKCAFQPSKPAAAEFLTVSSEFLTYAQGNPLALKVLGTHLCGKSIEVWKSEADKLKKYGNPGILKVLRISYDGLDELEQKIFLDLAIFFKGDYDKEDVEAFLSSCYGECYLSGVSRLVDVCLLEIRTISFFGKPYPSFYMHDMLEDLGKNIDSKGPFGKPRRLWRGEDVESMLSYNCEGANSIEGMKSDINGYEIRQTVFQSMPNLRFIEFFSKSFPRAPPADTIDIDRLSRQLRYLEWCYYPFKSLSSDFNPVNLVVLKLSCGNMERLWDGDQVPLNLRILDVSYCEELKKIPYNLSRATKLKFLNCMYCTSLAELPPLNRLPSLDYIYFEGCTSLEKFPEVPSKCYKLDLSETRIEQVPDSIEHLTTLQTLTMSGSMVKKVSSNISKLEFLEFLRMNDCYDLEILPQIPPNVLVLDADDCQSLTKVSFKDEDPPGHTFGTFLMSFSNCIRLEPESVDNIVENVFHKIEYLAMGSGASLFSRELICCFPGKEILANFDFPSESSSITLGIPEAVPSEIGKLAYVICLVLDLTSFHHLPDPILVCEKYLTPSTARGDDFRYRLYMLKGRKYKDDHVLILYCDTFTIDDGYEEASFTFYIKNDFDGESEYPRIEVKKCGLRFFLMLYGTDTDSEKSQEDASSEEVHEDYATEEVLASEEIYSTSCQ